ncbi:MAG: hypothetical protein AAFX94_15725, partial [Myxococcota bacterium]
DDDDLIKRYIDSGGTETRFVYDASDRLSQVIGPNAEVWTYRQDSNGDLVEVTGPDDTRVAGYTYETSFSNEDDDGVRPEKAKLNHNLLEVYPPVGAQPIVKNTYYDGDPESVLFDRLRTQSSPCGGIAAVRYEYVDGKTLVTDARGAKRESVYTEVERQVTRTASGLPTQTVSTFFDSAGRVNLSIDAKGIKREFEYLETNDPTRQGDLIATTVTGLEGSTRRTDTTPGPFGTPTRIEQDVFPGDRVTVTSDVDALGLVESVTAAGLVTAAEYNEQGLQTSATSSFGGKTVFEDFDASGQPRSITLPAVYGDDDTITQGYDARGNLVSQTDELGRPASFEYNAYSELLRATSWRGETSITRDGNRLPTAESIGFADGRSRQRQLRDVDCLGRPQAVEEAGTDDETRGLIYRYDNFGRLNYFEDGNRNIRTFEYDDFGRLSSETIGGEEAVRYSYDMNDNLTETTVLLGKTDGDDEDDEGPVVVTTNLYDEFDLPRGVRRSDGSARIAELDARGRPRVEEVRD